ncbi:MAG: HD domain-containing protein [Bacilli bacterium]|nr:HD domain-containing protein [Bacilli bacterium]
MDLDIAIKAFNEYVNTFDMNNDKIKLKHIHTFEVVNKSEMLAKKLKLNDEDIFLAKLIGLLHDIGRFEQVTKYDSFKDIDMDHADFGVKLLFEENMIRKFISDEKYDDIIYNAVKYHNKFEIPNNLDEKTELFCKIIRDADKIDIYRVRTEEYENLFYDEVSDYVLTEFNNNEPVKHKYVKNKTDSLIVIFAFFYDVNFKESFEILKETKIFDNFVNSIKVSENNKELFENIKNKLYKYLEV